MDLEILRCSSTYVRLNIMRQRVFQLVWPSRAWLSISQVIPNGEL